MRGVPINPLDRMERIVNALDVYWTLHRCAPTVRELAEQMGVTGWANIHRDLQRAAEKGKIAVRHDRIKGQMPHYMPWWVANAIEKAIEERAR